MDTKYQPKEIEKKWDLFWQEFCETQEGKEVFCLIAPPPNVTGVLHMGHFLTMTCQDILVRKMRMSSKATLFIPGTDHAGIATQSAVEKMLYKTTGKTREDFSPTEFLNEIWKFKEEKQARIIAQLRKTGASFDWRYLRFTLDEQSCKAVFSCFKQLFDDGLIYRGDYLVNWDPQLQTAISDDEVEHEEEESFLWYFRYPLEDGSDHLVIATTRPETMLGDVAVAVHPQDARFHSLVGKNIRLPLSTRIIPIIADEYVDPDFGSGCVKITPAHDENDYLIGKNHQLPMINIMTKEGKINSNGGSFAGLSMQDARQAVVEAMQKNDLVESIQPHTLRIGRSYRSNAIIQPYLSRQWFLRMEPFKQGLIDAVKQKQVKIVPEKMEQNYLHWIENLRDWCISRQLAWGHKIPVWHAKNKKDTFICSSSGKPPKEVVANPDEWIQDPDVLDTWFSSALWPLTTLGWPVKTQDFSRFYPTSTLITGHDILFFWVARMILMGKYLTKKVPFQEVFIHGLIYGKSYWREKNGTRLYVTAEEKAKYDREEKKIPQDVFYKWEKMSKSKGNVIDPLQVIERYGTDAVRFGLASCLTGSGQIDLDERKFEEQRNFVNKIWNSARFVFMSVEDLNIQTGIDPTLFTLEDHWILDHLNQIIKKTVENTDNYSFEKAANGLYNFYWKTFCSTYLETTKTYINTHSVENLDHKKAAIRENKQKILTVILGCTMRLLHPFIPFVTEEIFQTLKKQFSINISTKDPYIQDLQNAFAKKACIISDYPKPFRLNLEQQACENMQLLQEIVYHLRNIRGDMQIPLKEKIEVFLALNEQELSEEMQRVLFSLVRIKTIEKNLPCKKGFGAKITTNSMTLFVPLPESLREKELERLEKTREKMLLLKTSLESRLSNESFRNHAPKAIIQEKEQSLGNCIASLDEINKRLSELCE